MIRTRTPKTADPLYLSQAWRILRRLVLARDHYRCVICRADVTGPGRARVDHINLLRTHPHMALDLGNLRTLCTVCDAQSHRERRTTRSQARVERFVVKGIDANCSPLDPQHPWRR